MTGGTPATFMIDGTEYPIKPRIFPIIQSHLHEKDHVEWVQYEEPYIKYGVDTKTGIKMIRRQISELLSGTEMGRMVVSTLSLSEVEKD